MSASSATVMSVIRISCISFSFFLVSSHCLAGMPNAFRNFLLKFEVDMFILSTSSFTVSVALYVSRILFLKSRFLLMTGKNSPASSSFF